MATQKRIISLLLAVALLLTLAGCELVVIGNPEGSGSPDAGNPPSSPSDPSSPTDPSAPTEPSDPEVPTDPSAPTEPSVPAEPENPGNDDPSGGNEQEKEEEKDPPVSKPTSLDGLEIVKEAVKYLGTPYVYGGNSLTNGIDCSGFTQQIYKKFGIDLPRTSTAQSKVSGTRVSIKDALPGDLYAAPGHAGIYIGDGKMIHADGSVVTCTGLDYGWSFVLIRLFDNTCSANGKEVITELEKIAIANGHYGQCEGGDYYPETGKLILSGLNPLMTTKNISDYSLGYGPIDSTNIPSGYEDMFAAWKDQLIYDGNLDDYTWLNVVGPVNPQGEAENWAYYNGAWYSNTELRELYKAGSLTGYDIDDYFKCFCFKVVSWNSNATFITAHGEIVDISTFPKNPYPES